MNSTEARMRRIQKRAGELRRKKRRLRACALTAGCMAILIALGAAMPSISRAKRSPENGCGEHSGGARIARVYPDGRAGVFAGRVRDGASVPDSPKR